jgi:Na+/proline symporter
MQPLATALLVATLALGVVVGVFYLARARRRHLVSLHLILGTGATWAALALMQARPPVPGPIAAWAGGLLGFAVLGGVLPRLFGRRAPQQAELLLFAHVVAGIAGFFVFLAWSARL